MGGRNILQATFEQFASTAGFTMRSGRSCRRQQDTIAVIELQKSQYGAQYFVNVALWLLELGDAQCPREETCHLRSRLTRLIADGEARLNAVLNLDDPSIADESRRNTLLTILSDDLLPLLDICATMDGIRSLGTTGLLKSFLVARPAMKLLQLPKA